MSITIDAQPLQSAVLQLSRQTGISVYAPSEVIENKNISAINGEMTPENALEQMLSGTGLVFQRNTDGTYVIAQKSLIDDKQANSDASTSRPAYIEEVIVTAEKREQSLQDVPIAITAYSSEMLDARGIATPQDLQFTVPNLVIGEQFQGPAKVTMRGIGSENVFPGGDPGVPVHINGHYTQSTAYVLRDMLDVERVEVLRGPQGTLYGRNAIGGNINIITKRPTEEFEGSINGTVGNYGKRNLQAVVSGPLVGSLRGRLAVSDDKRDGYVENVAISGDDRDTSDYTSVRGTFLYNPIENIEINLSAYYFDDIGNPASRLLNEYPTGSVPIYPVSSGPNYYEINNAGANPSLSDPFAISNNTPSEQRNKSRGISADLSWSLEHAEFRSLTSYDKTTWEVTADKDGSSVVNAQNDFVMPFETFTQEFQLLSTGNNDFNWTIGTFFYDERSSYGFHSFQDQFATDVDGNGVVNQADPRRLVFAKIDVDSTSLGVFGQINYSITDQLELMTGLRYTKDKKKAADSGLSIGIEGAEIPPPLFGKITREKEWSETTGKLGINYHISDEAMLYTSFSQGYKAGGFNLLQEGGYDPERVNAWEAGLKSQWLSNRIRANLATFYYKYEDKQDFQRGVAPGTTQTVFWILNAAAATSKGIELEIDAYITDNFFVDLSLGYLVSEFTDFESIDDLAPPPANTQSQDLAGNKLPFSPELTFHIGAQYNWTLENNIGNLSLRGDYTWVEEQYSNAFNRDSSSGLGSSADFVPSYNITSAHFQWESNDADWLIQIYVRNLTNEVILSNPFVASGIQTFATYLAPRTYGLKVQYNF